MLKYKKEYFKSFIQACSFEQEKKQEGYETSLQYIDFYHGYQVTYTYENFLKSC